MAGRRWPVGHALGDQPKGHRLRAGPPGGRRRSLIMVEEVLTEWGNDSRTHSAMMPLIRYHGSSAVLSSILQAVRLCRCRGMGGTAAPLLGRARRLFGDDDPHEQVDHDAGALLAGRAPRTAPGSTWR